MINLTESQIMQNWNEKNTDFPLVSINCITYNHKSYIAQALEGFLIQKTTFPFEILVHDDASTDGTADIIRSYEAKYPNIIKPVYQTENQYSKYGFPKINEIQMARTRGKYIAFCEGDDYWTDPNKLQMQVDFLEQNPEYGLCYTKVRQFLQKKNKYIRQTFGMPVADYKDLIINGNRIPTLSVVMRTELEKRYLSEINPSDKHWLMGDYPRWIFVAHESKVKYFTQITSVYRILEQSASHGGDFEKIQKFLYSYQSIRDFYSKKYKVLLLNSESITKSLIYYCLENNESKSCRNISDDTLSLKMKLIRYSSYLPPLFVLIREVRKLYKSLRENIMERKFTRGGGYESIV